MFLLSLIKRSFVQLWCFTGYFRLWNSSLPAIALSPLDTALNHISNTFRVLELLTARGMLFTQQGLIYTLGFQGYNYSDLHYLYMRKGAIRVLRTQPFSGYWFLADKRLFSQYFKRWKRKRAKEESHSLVLVYAAASWEEVTLPLCKLCPTATPSATFSLDRILSAGFSQKRVQSSMRFCILF